MGTKSSAAIFQRAMDQVLAPFSNTNRFRVRHVQAQARDEPGAGELEVTPASMGSVRTDAEGSAQREERTGWAFGTAFAYVDDKATPRNINYKTQNLLQNERVTSPQVIIHLRRQQIVQLQIIPQRRRHVS